MFLQTVMLIFLFHITHELTPDRTRSTGSRQDSEQNLNKRQVQHVNMSADRLHLFLSNDIL